MRRILFVFVLTLAVLLAFPLAASASSGMLLQEPPVVPDLHAFLQWLIGGGGSILAVSWLLERMGWFQALTPDAKDYTIFGASIVVGCGALAVVTYVPAAALDALAPYFLIVASTFVTVFLAKLFHKADKPA